MKTCARCKQGKPFEAFYVSRTRKVGYSPNCKVCESERNRIKNASNKEKRQAKAKLWRDANKVTHQLSIKKWREADPVQLANIYRSWAERNRDKVNAKWMARYAAKKNRTPAWLNVDQLWMIEQAYDIAAVRTKALGISFHVDHIVPLQGKTVSGLHVPWNLQVIPAKENRSKSNRFN